MKTVAPVQRHPYSAPSKPVTSECDCCLHEHEVCIDILHQQSVACHSMVRCGLSDGQVVFLNVSFVYSAGH